MQLELVEGLFHHGEVVSGGLSKTKLAVLQSLKTQALTITKNPKIEDTWSRSWINVEKII